MAEVSTGLLDEHAPRDSTSDYTGYVPTDEEKKTIRMVQALFDKFKKHKHKYDDHWLQDYKFFRGKQWNDNRPSYRHSEVINLVFQAIQSMVPIMTDAKPKIEFVPRVPQDMELADILNQVFDCDWDAGNWLQELTAIIYDAHFYSIGYGGVEYDPKADLGAGAITFESKDPFYAFPDPNAVDVNKKSKCFIYAEPVDVELAKEEYPDKAKFIKADLIDLVGGSKTAMDDIKYRSPVDARVMVKADDQPEVGRSQTLKITCYMHSSESVEEQKVEQDDETGEESVVYESKLKYPNGRRIVLCGSILCEDGPMPFDDGKFPYARLVNYILPREYYGISEIEQLKGPQKVFNKLVSFALDVMTLMGNPIWVVDNDSEIDTDNLFNRPGLVIEKAKGSEVRRESGVELQPYVLQLIDRMKNWFDGISGSSDVSRGATPGDITAGSAISALQDAAQTRIRLKSRNLDAFLQDAGAMYLSRCLQFYTAPRIYRVTQDDGAWKYFKFYINQGEDGSKTAVVRDYSFGAEGPVESEAREYQIKGMFDVKVTTGSSLPFAKTQKVQLAEALFDRGAIDGLEFLKATDYPNYQAVWDQVQERKAHAQQQQLALQAQAQAAGMQPQGGPPQGQQ